MSKPYIIQKIGPLISSGLCLLLVSANAVHAQTLPQYSLPFNGTNQYVGVPNTATLEFTTGTIEMWVKPTWTAGSHGGANLCLISERSGAVNGGTRFSLHMNNDMRAIGLWNGISYQTVSYTFTKGTWYHIAAVMTTSGTQFYVNGTFVAATTNGINTSKAGYDLKIGISETEGPNYATEYFEGELDEVRIWNTARTATDILANYLTPISTTSAGLVAYYPIDNGITGASNATARALKDYTANNYGGTLYNYWAELTPTISSFTPTRNAASAARNGNLGINFSQNINNAAVSDGLIKVFGSQTGQRGGVFSGSGTSVITFDPTLDLKPGEKASVTVTAAKSMGGLALASPQVMQFTGAATKGLGTFPSSTAAATTTMPMGTALGDLDGDGILDAVVASLNGGVLSVLRGLGNGTYATKVDFTIPQWCANISLADLDGDGRLDILVPDSYGGNVLVFRNLTTGSGALSTSSFAASVSYAAGFTGPDAVVAEDMDGDGRPDLVVAGSSSVGVLRNLTTAPGALSSSSFATSVSYAAGPAIHHVAVGDLDNDGRLDIVAINNSSTNGPGSNSGFSVLRNLTTTAGAFTTSSFAARVAYITDLNPFLGALSDLDGDGRLDVVLSNNGAGGNGGGSSLSVFHNAVSVPGTFGSSSFDTPLKLTTTSNPFGLAIGDVNGDGRPDLFNSTTGGYVNYFLNQAANPGTLAASDFPSRTDIQTTASSYGMAIGDLDNDGDLDLAIADRGASALQIRLNANAPVLTSLSPTSGTIGNLVTLSGTDLNGATAVSFNGTSVPSSRFSSSSATSITVAVPAGATTGPVTVNTATSTSNGLAFTVLAPSDLTVSNAQTVSNSTYRNITVASGGVLTLGAGVAATGTVLVQDGGTLNTNCQALTGAGSFALAAGGTLGICDAAGIAATGSLGAVQTTGTRSFSPDANYVYNGTTTQRTGNGLPSQVRSLTITNARNVALSAPVSIAQTLTVGGAGNLQLNNQALTLLSSASGTALVVNSGTGAVLGNTATVQRYLDPSCYNGLGYRHYSAPVSGSTVGDLATTTGFAPVVNPAYNSAAAPGTVTPFPTVFGYDQSLLSTSASNYSAFDKGFFSPTIQTDQLAVGRGYAVQLDAAQLVDFTGQLNTGDQALSLSRNTDATAPDAGWALVGNPYPAPLDWSQVAPADRTGLDGSIYVVQSSGPYTGSYRTYVNNLSTSVSNDPLIGMGQGFFVRVSAGQSSGTLTFRNSQRVTSYGTQVAVQRTAADPRPLVRLSLRTGAGQADGLVVYAEGGATASFDASYDAGKFINSTGLNLASLSAANEPLAIDGRPAFTAATVVPLTVGVPAAGTYALAAATIKNLPAGLNAYLTDAQTGQTIQLSQQASYSFSVTAAEATALLTGRFTLRFSPVTALATTVSLSASEVSIYPNPAHASFAVRLPAVAGTSQVQAQLLNALGQVVRQQSAALPTTGTTFTVDAEGLPTGVYTLRLQAGAATLAKRIILH